MNQDSTGKVDKQMIDEKIERIRRDCCERHILPIAIVGLSTNLLDDNSNELVYIRYNNRELPLDHICTGIKTIRIYNGNHTDNSMIYVDSFSYKTKAKKSEQNSEQEPKPKPLEPITETKKLNIWERLFEFFDGFYVKG